MRKYPGSIGAIFSLLATSLFGAAPDARVSLVASLYREFAWEVVVVEPTATTFLGQPESVLSRYLAPDLLRLLMKDRACVAEREEVCSLDFSPIWGGNDPAAADLRITAGATPDEVLARFTYPHDKRPVEICYDMVEVDGAWRIGNIRTRTWSLVAILERPL